VLQVYPAGVYMVEFADDDEATLALLDLAGEDLTPYRDTRFEAAAVAAEMIDGVFVLAFAENPDGSGLGLQLCAGPYSAQDAALGEDTYSISTDTGACHYGGIASQRVTDGRVFIALDTDAAAVLATDGFLVTFAADKTDLVRDALGRILAGSDNVRAWRAWKRIVAGLCGVGVVVALLLLLKQRRVSGDDAQRVEEAIVYAVAAAGLVVWIVKRRQRRRS